MTRQYEVVQTPVTKSWVALRADTFGSVEPLSPKFASPDLVRAYVKANYPKMSETEFSRKRG